MPIELSYCVVSTDGRRMLRYCLDAIARERATVPFETEVLVLDNASGDDSAQAARDHPATTAVLVQPTRRPRGANDATLLAQADGRFCLLLDQDSELEPGATAALHDVLAGAERGGAACATRVLPDGTPLEKPALWRRLLLPGQPAPVRRIRSCRTGAMLVRAEAAEAVGSFDHRLGDGVAEADFCRRLRRARWSVLLVPDARAVEHASTVVPR